MAARSKLLEIEPFRPDGFYLGLYLEYNTALYAVLGRVLAVPEAQTERIEPHDVIVFRPLTYTEAAGAAYIEEGAVIAVIDNYDDNLEGVPIALRPLSDRLAIETIEKKNQSDGGIYLPDTASRLPTKGIVRAVGLGAWENGARVPMECQVGDVVSYPEYQGQILKVNPTTEYLIIRERDVLCILETAAERELAGAA